MAQGDMNIANQGFPAFRADLNDQLEALVTNSSGATAPATTFPHQWWLDTSTTPSTLRQRNAANDAWIVVGLLNQSTNTFNLPVAQGGTGAADAGGARTNLGALASTDPSYTGTLTGGTGVINIGSGQLYKDASGNVGIGTSSPSGNLNVNTTGNTQVTISAGNTGLSRLVFQGQVSNNRGFIDYDNTSSVRAMIFRTDETERLRIDSSGNLLVGTTSLLTGNPRLNVSSTGGYTATLVQTDNLDRVAVSIQNIYSRSGQNGTMLQFLDNTGAERGSIKSTNTTTTYATSSDYRLKHDIQPMTGALAKVAQLKPVTYKWNADDSQSQGFIAHELQEVVPECVTGEKDAVDKDGKPVYQGIDTSFLVATLTAAIQEQQAIIESLKTRIEALEGTQP
jgi:hypothetical protein